MAFDRKLLARLRAEQRYSQRELAAAARVKSAWLASVEAGKSKSPDYFGVRRCARVLGVDPDIFFADDDGNCHQTAAAS